MYFFIYFKAVNNVIRLDGFTLLEQSHWFRCSRQDRLLSVAAVVYRLGHNQARTPSLCLCLWETHIGFIWVFTATSNRVKQHAWMIKKIFFNPSDELREKTVKAQGRPSTAELVRRSLPLPSFCWIWSWETIRIKSGNRGENFSQLSKGNANPFEANLLTHYIPFVNTYKN